MRRLALVLLIGLLGACGEKAGDPAAGHALLDEFVESMKALGRSGSVAAFDAPFAEQALRSAKLREAGAVSAEFAERHARLIKVTRSMMKPDPDAAVQSEIDAFLDAVEGPKADRDPGGGMAAVAPAMVEEILNLHMLLDGTTDRATARAKYLDKHGL